MSKSYGGTPSQQPKPTCNQTKEDDVKELKEFCEKNKHIHITVYEDK